MKHLFSSIVAVFFLLSAYAQDDLKTILPVDPQVRTGTLSNGMKYYIRKNSKPEHRAELRLVVNAGSTAEDDDQLGLAHLTEHMAFNGTKNFKKSELVDYLESAGIKFGADLNAYTSFDETVYMLQVPTDSESVLNKGLLVLQDWAQNLSHDSVEVEKERGVVVEEWRLGQGANERMRRKYWPVLFKDSRYALRIPIGTKETIMGSSQATLRKFYSDWYRPDLMAIVAVGDFDLDAMEQKIKKQFSSIPPKANERPLKSWDVPDNKDLMIATCTDKEATFSVVQIFFKQPVELETTVGDYRKNLAEQLYSSMLNARMSELQRQADPPFMFSFSGLNDIVRTKACYLAVAVCKEDKIERALTTLAEENERVRRFGFTATELDRQKNEMLKQMEKTFNERDKTESRAFTDECVRNFLEKEPMPGIAYEFDLYKKYIPGITLEEINAFAKKWITDGTNAVVVITAPEKETTKIPSDAFIKETIKGMPLMNLKPYEDKVVDKPFIAKMPSPGTITETKEVKEFGITEWKLSNGARVIIKPTDFKNDEILFSAAGWGGSSMIAEKDYLSANFSASLIDQSGLGDFDANALDKLWSGKIANVSPFISELQQGMNGSCAPANLEDMMQMVYQYFRAPRKDSVQFQSMLQQQKGFLSNKNSDPQSIFRDTVSYFWSGYNYRSRPMSVDMLNEINLDQCYKIYRQRFGDASNFTFFFVGNFKPEELKPLVEKYIGGLPSTYHNDTWKDIGVVTPTGKVSKTVKKGVEPKSAVQLRFSMPFEYNRNNRNEVSALFKLVNIKLRESLREDKSGVYGVGASPNMKHYPNQSLEITISFGCAPENVDMLIKAVNDVIDDLKKNACDDKNLTKVKELSLREREAALKENNFWLGVMSSSYMNGENILEIQQYNNWVNGLKADDLKSYANKYLKTDNYATFILNPEK